MIEHREGRDGKTRHRARVYRPGGKRERGPWRTVERQARKDEAQLLAASPANEETVATYAAQFLDDYQRKHKESSADVAERALAAFVKEFGPRRLDSITRAEAKRWARGVSASRIPVIVTMFNHATDEDELLERNPFRGLSRRTRGRADERPPTEAELERLLVACSALGDYAPKMRALINFAAYTGMRPGELFALEWSDVDFDAMRIMVRRRLYKGSLDVPKSNRIRQIALTPPARDALVGLPRTSALVFTGKRGGRLSQPTLSGYWSQVLARSGLDFDFYLATKHYAVHYLYVTLELPPRVIAEQMGWTVEGVMALLRVYGHGEIGALEEIDRAFAGARVTRLRDVSDPSGSRGRAEGA
ncbi:MAG: integrase [Thermoleophilaceae bacterium]|nr:integrase [Thermoleophilaceae bacterium]